MQLNCIATYEYGYLEEALEYKYNEDFKYIFFDLYKDMIKEFIEGHQEDADGGEDFKEINISNLSWESIQDVRDEVIDYVTNAYHFTEIISNILDKKYDYKKIVHFEENYQAETYTFYVSDLVITDKKELLDLIADNFKELSLSLEEIREHLTIKFL